MEILGYIKGKEVLICTIVLLIGLTLYGHRRGLIHMAVSVGSVIITVMATNTLLPYMEMLIRKGNFTNKLFQKWNESLTGRLGDEEYGPLYDLLGLSEFCDKAGEVVFGFLVKGIAFLLLFVLIFIIVRLIAGIMDIFARLPIIYGMNQIGGAIIGFLEAVFIVWIVMLFVSFFPEGNLCKEIMKQIYSSEILLFIYKNNMLLRFLTGMLGIFSI